MQLFFRMYLSEFNHIVPVCCAYKMNCHLWLFLLEPHKANILPKTVKSRILFNKMLNSTFISSLVVFLVYMCCMLGKNKTSIITVLYTQVVNIVMTVPTFSNLENAHCEWHASVRIITRPSK